MASNELLEGVSRRTVLKATAGMGAVAGLTSVAFAQEGGSDGAIQQETIELGGEISGWVGQSPPSIEGATNPTLMLVSGQTYTVNWESLDDASHNFGLLDSSGSTIQRTDTGQSGSLTFEVTEEIAQYNCGIHPNSMVGDVEIVTAATTTEETTTTTEETTTEETTTEETTTEQTTTEEATTEETTTEQTTAQATEVTSGEGKAKQGDSGDGGDDSDGGDGDGVAGGGNGKAKATDKDHKSGDGDHENNSGSHEHGGNGKAKASEDDHGGDGHSHGGEGHSHMSNIPDGPASHANVTMLNMAGGHHFDPHVVWVEPGGTVTWTLESGAHSTTAYHPENDRPLRIPDQAAAWDSGVLTEQGTTFEHTFAVEGVYDYFCIPHEAMGMLGSVIVGHPDPHDQIALDPPQESLPEAARTKIKELNEMVNEALGHTH